jgi:phosphatidylserine decarboxylase
MSSDIKTFVRESKKIKASGRDEIDHEEFFRDPARPNFVDPQYFYSPADGIILYQKEVEPDEKILDVKGKNFHIHDLMEDDTYNKRSLVIGIFMTEFDVHINRVPYAGTLKYKELEPLSTVNLPMLATQNKILKGIVDQSAPEYIKRNQRMLNTIYSPILDLKYYVIQIADEDINLICPFNTNQNVRYNQNVRFSMVRWGSQVDLIIPLDKRYEFEFVQKEKQHVEGGMDRLVKVVAKKEIV